MTNGEFVDAKKIKDILTYIKSMKHSEQIRMMFLFSLNGLRSINFAYLQVKDCYTDNVNNIKKSGYFASRIVTAIVLREFLCNEGTLLYLFFLI